jgi:hypothetical protein
MLRRVISLLVAFGCVLVTEPVLAGGWTHWGTPTQVDVKVTSDNAGNPVKGIMVFGQFGNPAGCSVGDRFYISESHLMFSQVYAAVLAANISGRRIRGYVGSCAPHRWYSEPYVTYGVVAGDAINFGN